MVDHTGCMAGQTKPVPRPTPRVGGQYGRYLPVRTVSVEVAAGPDRGARLEAASEHVTVGSAPGNDLVLGDESVSRYHLELHAHEDGVALIDCGSTNGTRIGAVRIERAVVPAGTLVELGRTRLRVDGGGRALVELHGDDAFGALRGRTPVMRRLFARLEKAAQSDIAVLLVGESGTGKELIARALHERSPRAAGPFVTVDCGALAPSLVASELFGHERGAFTGAHEQRLGAFERTGGGTLFLDEIGELPGDLQSSLLGVLERRAFHRVGGDREIRVDVRIVAATNRDLRAEVNAQRFRLDLYYRLAVMTIEVPPLRERLDDIALLVRHFLEECGHAGDVEDVFSDETMADLQRHRWPGNVRELRNLVEATLAMGETIRPSSEELRTAAKGETLTCVLDVPYGEARTRLLDEFEARYLRALLARAEGNVSQAARLADMNRSHLFTLLRRHGLR
jgi:DNA-binding NtrC family response regulator